MNHFKKLINKKLLLGLFIVFGLIFLLFYFKSSKEPEIILKKDAAGMFGIHIKDGVIYHGTLDGRFKAVDAKTDQLKWEFKLNGNDVLASKPMLSGGNVHFLTDKGDIYSLNISSGEQVDDSGIKKEDFSKANTKHLQGWYFRDGDRSPIIEFGNHKLYEEHGYLFLEDINGKNRWKVKTGTIYSNPIIVNKTLYYMRLNYIFPGDSHWQSLHAIDLENGSHKWNWNKPVRSDPLEDEGLIYFLGDDFLYLVK